MRASALTTFLAGVALVLPAYLGLLVTGVPTKACPLPLLTVLPAFVLSTWRLHYAAVFLPMILFWGWNPKLFGGQPNIPRRSYALVAALILLNALWFAFGWKLGVQYEGESYTRFVCLANVAWSSLLCIAFARAWKNGSTFLTNLILHWAVFAWLSWYAFPYLGELP
jgi:hypothetical protein